MIRHECMQRWLSVILLVGMPVCALTINSASEKVTIDSDWSESGTVTFQGAWNAVKPYNSLGSNHGELEYRSSSWSNGLHFTNGRTNTVDNNFDGSDVIVVGVEGEGTVVEYGGSLNAENNGALNLKLSNGGMFKLGADARCDLVNGALYTRQMWVLGNGTGTFEVEEGFVADRSKGYGFGSYRFSNATFISHSTEGLPTNEMDGCSDCPDGYEHLNGHLVFENEGGSRWIVRSNDQVYKAALWIWKPITIVTEKNLTHLGRFVHLQTVGYGEYPLAAGFQLLSPGITLTKEGPAALILDGEQAYESNTTMDIRAGTVNFNTDATGGTFRGGGNGGQELQVQVADGATAAFNHNPVRIKSLSMSGGANCEVLIGAVCNVGGDATLGGTLRLTSESSTTIQEGDEFDIFDWGGSVNGTFSDIKPDGVTWDTERLYTDGILRVGSGSTAMHALDRATVRAIGGPRTPRTLTTTARTVTVPLGTTRMRVYDPAGRLLTTADVSRATTVDLHRELGLPRGAVYVVRMGRGRDYSAFGLTE